MCARCTGLWEEPEEHLVDCWQAGICGICGCAEQQRTVCPWSHVGILEFIFCLGASTHKTNREVRDLVEILVGTKTVNCFKDQQQDIFLNVLERFKILITD